MPSRLSRRGFYPAPFQLVLDERQPFSVEVHFIDEAYGFRLFGVDIEIHLFLVALDDRLLAIISENVAVAVEDAVVHGRLLTGFHADRGFAAFVLRQRRHDGEPKLTITVERFDIVVDEKDLHAPTLQISGVLERIHRVSCKTRYLTGDDQVELAPFRRRDHTHKMRALISRRARDTFVDILLDEIPFGVRRQNRLVPVHLIFKRRQLRFVFR